MIFYLWFNDIKNIEELSFSGLKIFTTLDVKLQKEAQFSMRKNLSRIETILQGFQVESKEKYKKLRTIKPNSFIYAKVDQILGNRFSNYEIELSVGHIKGLLSNQALRRYAKLLNLSTSKGVAFHIDEMIHNIKKGDILYLQVLTFDKKTEEL